MYTDEYTQNLADDDGDLDMDDGDSDEPMVPDDELSAEDELEEDEWKDDEN